MKTVTTISAIAAIGLSSVGFASPAMAWHLSPVGAFTGAGSLTVTAAAVSLPCTMAVSGNSTASGTTINSVTFSGVSCLALTASHLPWKLVATHATRVNIQKIEVSALVLGICGPSKVRATDLNGVIAFSGAALSGLVPCSASSTFKTTPRLKILPD